MADLCNYVIIAYIPMEHEQLKNIDFIGKNIINMKQKLLLSLGNISN